MVSHFSAARERNGGVNITAGQAIHRLVERYPEGKRIHHQEVRSDLQKQGLDFSPQRISEKLSQMKGEGILESWDQGFTPGSYKKSSASSAQPSLLRSQPVPHPLQRRWEIPPRQNQQEEGQQEPPKEEQEQKEPQPPPRMTLPPMRRPWSRTISYGEEESKEEGEEGPPHPPLSRPPPLPEV